MRSRTERTIASWFVVCACLCSSTALAQTGEVLPGGDAELDLSDNTSPSNNGDADSASTPAHGDEPNEDGQDELFPLRVGADNHIEIGGHMFATLFTQPSSPDLNPGLGFQGRIATPIYGRFIAEGNVGIMFNRADVNNSAYTLAFLRAGGRYPFELDSYPVFFFLGAGVALDIVSVSRTDTRGEHNSASAVTPAFDIQFGLGYDIGDRFAVEVIAQATYAMSNVVWSNDAASWVALFGGVSYDL